MLIKILTELFNNDFPENVGFENRDGEYQWKLLRCSTQQISNEMLKTIFILSNALLQVKNCRFSVPGVKVKAVVLGKRFLKRVLLNRIGNI